MVGYSRILVALVFLAQGVGVLVQPSVTAEEGDKKELVRLLTKMKQEQTFDEARIIFKEIETEMIKLGEGNNSTKMK